MTEPTRSPATQGANYPGNVSAVPMATVPSEYWKLEITLVNGKDIKQLNWMDIPDPYVICRLGGINGKKVFETKVIDNDPNPVWNCLHETMWNGVDQLVFQVQESNVISDQFIGAATFDGDIRAGFYGTIAIRTLEGQPAGALTVRINVVKRPVEKAATCGGCCPVS